MNNSIKFFKALNLLVFAVILFNSCDKDKDETEPVEAAPAIEIADIGAFGKVLVDQNKQALYFSANDISGESVCSGGCADAWPPFTENLFDLEFGDNLNSDDFGFVTRDDGTKQVTFKGWPLYYFSPDADGELEAPGAVSGDGRGDVFYVAKPDYSLFLGKQTVEEGSAPVLYLVDNNGVSLYHNTGDEEELSNCVGGCANVWPPFVTSANLVIPSLVDPADFTVVYRDDEFGPQLAYLGNPLYRFSLDEEKRGIVLGHGGGPAQSFFVVDPR